MKPPVDDLFGDEDLGMDPPPAPSLGGEGRRLPVKALAVAIGAVLFALLWYLSSLHHENYYLVADGEMVRVERGYYFPFGSGGWAPNRAYESFRLPPGVGVRVDGAVSAEALDAELYRLYAAIAEVHLENAAEGDPNVAEDMLMRANKLSYTSLTQERQLLERLGDVAFVRGMSAVRDLDARFDQALHQFRLADMRGGVRYKGAAKWVQTITRLRDEFRNLSRESGVEMDVFLGTAKPSANPEPTPPAVEPDAGVE